MRKHSLFAGVLVILSLLDLSVVTNAEPCQATSTAYSAIYTCVDPEVVLGDPAIQCDPVTCLWNLDLFNPDQPPEPCAAILLLEQQVDNLPDLLEPCLWWEMLHGDLGYLLPEPLPTTNVTSPSPSPLDAVSVAPTFDASDAPTSDVSMTPSYLLLTTNTPAPSSFIADRDVTPSPSTVSRLSVPLQSMLLTFVFESYSGFRLRSRRSLQEKAGLLATDESAAVLMEVTKAHIIANIPELVDVDLTMSRVDQGETPDETMETVLLMGTLYFAAEAAAADTLPNLSPASVRRQVEDVFDDNVSVLRYIHALRETDEIAFDDIVLVYPGIVSPDSQVESSSSEEEESFWESFFFNWENPVWIVVAAGISAAGLGLCVVFSVTCYLRAERRKERAHQQLATRKSDDTSKTAGERNPYNVDLEEQSVLEDEVSVTGQSEIGYQPSEVTSVYSYLDNNNTMLDDQSFSVAPSYTFPGNDYDDNRSVLWSVIDDAKHNDILDDLDSIADVSLPTKQKIENTKRRAAVPKRQNSEDSDDDVYSLLSRNDSHPQPVKTKTANDSALQGSSPSSQSEINSLKTPAAVDGVPSKASPDSSSGASHTSRESLTRISKMIPGFRSKLTKVKTSSDYKELDDESDGSHHSWDKELSIQPSPDDLDEDSVFLDDSEEDETVASQLVPLSSIQRISSGGDTEDSDGPLNETAVINNDDSSVDSGDSQEHEVEPAQFVIPISDSTEAGYLGTISEDTTRSDGKDSKSSEKENLSSDALLDGNANDSDGTFSESEIDTETNAEKQEHRRLDESSAPPLTEKPECSVNTNTSDNLDDAGISGNDKDRREKIETDHFSKKEQLQMEEVPVDLSNEEPLSPASEQEVPAIDTLASF